MEQDGSLGAHAPQWVREGAGAGIGSAQVPPCTAGGLEDARWKGLPQGQARLQGVHQGLGLLVSAAGFVGFVGFRIQGRLGQSPTPAKSGVDSGVLCSEGCIGFGRVP